MEFARMPALPLKTRTAAQQAAVAMHGFQPLKLAMTQAFQQQE